MVFQRLYNFVSGTRISSSQMDGELDQIIAALNQHTTDIAAAETDSINFTKGFGLGDITKDVTGTTLNNLNNIDVTGFYGGSGLTNYPPQLLSGSGFVITIKMNVNTRKQIYTPSDSNRTFVRYQISGVWQSWDEVFTTGSNWNNLTLQNGAVVNNSRTPRYIKIGNIVIVQGEIGTIADNTIVATLPVSFRPSIPLNMLVPLANGATTQSALISVGTDGTLKVLNKMGTSAICFNGITFVAEQ